MLSLDSLREAEKAKNSEPILSPLGTYFNKPRQQLGRFEKESKTYLSESEQTLGKHGLRNKRCLSFYFI